MLTYAINHSRVLHSGLHPPPIGQYVIDLRLSRTVVWNPRPTAVSFPVEMSSMEQSSGGREPNETTAVAVSKSRSKPSSLTLCLFKVSDNELPEGAGEFLNKCFLGSALPLSYS